MDKLGQYQVLGEIGRGGCGVVYRALDPRIGRAVAIKTIQGNADAAQSASLRERFRREARSAGALSHPNIVTIYEFDDSGETMYIAMEFVEGQTLSQRMTGDPLPLDFVTAVVQGAAEALDYAHSRHIVHRDVKPGNFLITPEGLVKVTDFGIAKMLDEDLNLTHTGMVLGTAQYMSPEQVHATPVTGRSDQFSLGVIAYEMLTGQRPFQGDSWANVIHKIISVDPAPVKQYRANLSDAVTAVLRKAMAKDPEARYATCRDFARELRTAVLGADTQAITVKQPDLPPTQAMELPPPEQTGKPVTASPGLVTHETSSRATIPLTQPQAKPKLNWRYLAAAAVVAVLIVAAGLYWFVFRDQALDSLAVLPFQNVGSDQSTEYLSDGIAESIINSISQLPRVAVRSFSSVVRYKGKEFNAKTIGGELSVRAILTGRLVRRGDQLSVNVELIDVKNDRQIWGGQYTRPAADALTIQEEISREISQNLRLALTGEEKKQMTRGATVDAAAYQLYLQGRYHLNKRTLDDLQQSIDYFQQAVDKDPRYALAYAGQADAYAQLADFNVLPAKEVMPKVKAAANKAIELDGSLAEAHTSLAWARFHDWDWIGAEGEFKSAVQLNPGYAAAHSSYAEYLMASGRFNEAQTEVNRARELDPLSLVANLNVGVRSYYSNQFPQAVEQFQKTLAIDAQFVPAHVFLGRAWQQQNSSREAIAEFRRALELSEGDTNELAALGHAYAVSHQEGEAQKILAQLNERSQQTYVQPTWMALIYSGMGQKDRAFDWLQKAYQDRSTWMVFLKVDPDFSPLRSDARFGELIQRVGIPASR